MQNSLSKSCEQLSSYACTYSHIYILIIKSKDLYYVKGRRLLSLSFYTCVRHLYMCWRLRTVVRESCCHYFERQHPQMMQHDISGLYVAQSGLLSCQPVTCFIKAYQKKEKDVMLESPAPSALRSLPVVKETTMYWKICEQS